MIIVLIARLSTKTSANKCSAPSSPTQRHAAPKKKIKKKIQNGNTDRSSYCVSGDNYCRLICVVLRSTTIRLLCTDDTQEQVYLQRAGEIIINDGKVYDVWVVWSVRGSVDSCVCASVWCAVHERFDEECHAVDIVKRFAGISKNWKSESYCMGTRSAALVACSAVTAFGATEKAEQIRMNLWVSVFSFTKGCRNASASLLFVFIVYAHCTDCKRQRITVSSYKGTWNGTVIKPRNSCQKRYLFSSSFESFLLIVFSTTRHTNGWALIGVGSRSVWNERSRLTMHGEECCVSGVHRLLSSNRIFNKSKTYLWDADWPLHTCKSIVIELDTNCGSKGTQNRTSVCGHFEVWVRHGIACTRFPFSSPKMQSEKVVALFTNNNRAAHKHISEGARAFGNEAIRDKRHIMPWILGEGLPQQTSMYYNKRWRVNLPIYMHINFQ